MNIVRTFVVAGLLPNQRTRFRTSHRQIGHSCGTGCNAWLRAKRRAFTLLELVVALLASSMLLVGLASALFLTMQATQPDLGGHESSYQSSEAVVELASELRFAQSFSERTDKSVEFTIADRTGDTNDDTIRWEWSGIAGDPLTRQFNGGTVANVLDNVHDFRLAYLIDSLETIENQTGPVVSDEFMLANFEGWPGISPTSGRVAVGPSSWAAEYFVAQGLPLDLVEMAITRVSLRVRRYLGGDLQVAIHLPQASGNELPQTSPVGSPSIVDATTLPLSFEWRDFTFPDVTFNQLVEEFVIVVKGTISNAAEVERLYSKNAPSNSRILIWTTDAGSSWDPRSNQRDQYDMYFRAYGTYTTISEQNTTVTRYFVVASDMSVQVGPDAANTMETTSDVVNRPEVPGP